jgi:hypothetical protein
VPSGMGGTLDRRLRSLETCCWGRYRLGLLSVIYSTHLELL